MYELIYTSVGQKIFSSFDLLEILEQARNNNIKLNITGMLVYKDQEFAQILEGEKETVKNLYEKIRNDPRHTSVKVFHEDEIHNRYFSEWSMAFAEIKKDARFKLGNKEFDYDTPISEALSAEENIGIVLFKSLLNEFLDQQYTT